MKTILLAVLIAALTGCTTRTEFGECIGLVSDKDPTLTYKLSIWNAAMGIIFVETIIVPLVVVANDALCPVGKRDAK